MVGLLATGALVLAACGGDDDDGADTTAAPATTAAPVETEAPDGTDAPETTAAPADTEAPGGTDAPVDTEAPDGPVAADPSLSPVVVGFHNLEGGAVSLPELRESFEAGVEYVNSQLGGINGHPMEVNSCNVDFTPETSINCANKFVDENVVVSVTGADFVFDAALPILQEAGIVDLTPYAAGPLSNTAQGDVYSLTYSNEEGFAASLVLLKNLGATTVAQVHADIPAMQASMTDTVEPVAETLGLEIQPYFYTSGQTDWPTFAATMLTGNPDAINIFATDADCIGAVQALRDAGFDGTIVAGVCVSLATQLDTALLDKVYVGSTFYNPDMVNIPEEVQPEVDIFTSYVDWDTLTTPGSALQGFYMAVMTADMLRQVPGDEISAADVKNALGSTSGSTFMRGGEYDCSQPTWPGTTACASGFIYSAITADGDFEVLPDQPVDISGVRPA